MGGIYAGMISEADLLAVIDAYAKSMGLSDSVASFRLFGDSKRVGAMRSGATITVRRLNDTLIFLSSNWPRKAKWPKGVCRPRKQVEAAE